MDAVYILGKGSLSENLELFYSVRSLAQHMLDLDNIYVIGEEPRDLPSVTHIHAEDPYKEPWKNAYYKTRVACDQDKISVEFLLMNDDFFMLEPFYGAQFPFYSVKGGNGGVDGQQSFHVHCPIRINKEWYSKMPLDIEASGTHSPRTFYANFYRAPATPVKDFIMRHGEGMLPYDAQIVGRQFFSIGDDIMLKNDFKLFLDSLYKMPSRFER